MKNKSSVTIILMIVILSAIPQFAGIAGLYEKEDQKEKNNYPPNIWWVLKNKCWISITSTIFIWTIIFLIGLLS